MNLRGVFWRFAHKRYHVRKPSIGFEIALFVWGGIFLVSFFTSFVTDWVRVTNVAGAIIFVFFPLTIAFLHRRIRLERAKGPEALYRKRVMTNG